jgi:hypothetical protein
MYSSTTVSVSFFLRIRTAILHFIHGSILLRLRPSELGPTELVCIPFPTKQSFYCPVFTSSFFYATRGFTTLLHFLIICGESQAYLTSQSAWPCCTSGWCCSTNFHSRRAGSYTGTQLLWWGLPVGLVKIYQEWRQCKKQSVSMHLHESGQVEPRHACKKKAMLEYNNGGPLMCT